MAKIYGFSFKKVKTFVGEEGVGFTADMYFDKKKIALVYDYSTGAGTDFRWEIAIPEEKRKEYLELVGKYYEDSPKYLYYKTPEGKFIEFIDELYELHDLEKTYKKVAKKQDGKCVLWVLSHDKRDAEPTSFGSDKIFTSIQYSDALEKKLKEEHNPAEITVYQSLGDFTITPF